MIAEFCLVSDKENTSLAAKNLLFEVALKHFGVALCDSDIVKDSRGKPFDRQNRIFFNISHSGNCVAVCCDNCPCGADIQKIVPISDKVMKKLGVAMPYSKDDKIRTAFWALAESYIKKTGEGFSGISSVPHFEIPSEIKNEFTNVPSNSKKELFVIKERNGFIFAVCYEKPICENAF